MTKTLTFWKKDELSDFFMEPRKFKLYFLIAQFNIDFFVSYIQLLLYHHQIKALLVDSKGILCVSGINNVLPIVGMQSHFGQPLISVPSVVCVNPNGQRLQVGHVGLWDRQLHVWHPFASYS